MSRRFMGCVSWYLALCLFIISSIAPGAEAAFPPSETTVSLQYDRVSDLEGIQRSLEIKMVKEKLRQLGFSQNEIQQRLSRLDDRQIHQLALKLDELRVGGSLGAVAAIAVTIAVILTVIATVVTIIDMAD